VSGRCDANRFAKSDMKRATIAEVAADANVSRATVSQVLNGRRPVAAPTRDRVLASVERLNYRPHSVARSLRTQRSLTIGLMVPDITNPFYPELTRSFQDVAYGRSYHTMICNTDGDAEREREAARHLLDRQVDGLLLVAFGLSGAEIDDIAATVPTAFVGDPALGRKCDQVHLEDTAAARDMTRWLFGRGYRRLGFLAGTPRLGPSDVRLAAFLAVCQENNDAAAGQRVVFGEYSVAGGAKALVQLVGAADPPDAVFCANDQIAIGALHAADELGLSVPGDLGITGFDDIEPAAYVRPALTTVANPAADYGRLAAELIIDRIEHRGLAPRELIIPHRLVVRDSA
jgi:LacI family transcriptional regulator